MNKKELTEKERSKKRLEGLAEHIKSNKNNQKNREAIQTLIVGCRLAQENGVYTLEEARTIMNAIEVLNSDK